MDSLAPLIFILIVTGILVYNLYFTEVAKVKRKLKKGQLKFLGDFTDGEVGKFIGKVVFINEPMIAPFSKRPCAFYFVQVLEETNDSKSVVIEEGYKINFLIQDGEFFAYVNSDNLKCHLVEDAKYSSGTWDDPPGHLEEFMKKYSFNSTTLLGFNKALSYNEGILEEHERVSVHGKGVWKKAVDLGLPETYGLVLEVSEPYEGSVYLSDDPDTTVGVAQREYADVRLYDYRKKDEA